MNLRSSSSRRQKLDSMSILRSRPTITNTIPTKDTKNSRPRDANYQQKLIDAGVLPYG